MFKKWITTSIIFIALAFGANVFGDELIYITSCPYYIPKAQELGNYSPVLEFNYYYLTQQQYKLKVWLLYPYESWPCGSSTWCEKEFIIDNTSGKNPQGIFRVILPMDVYDYPNNELVWVIRLYDSLGTEVNFDMYSATAILNRAPIITSPENPVGYVGIPFSFNVTASDSDNDPIILGSNNLPATASFSESGRFDWFPHSPGEYKIIVNAYDNLTYNSKEISFEIKENPNTFNFEDILIQNSRVTGKVVSDTDLSDYNVFSYIFINGYGWITKPYFSTPKVTINPDGTFTFPIVTGGIDSLATIVYVGVCHKDAPIPLISSASSVPSDIPCVLSEKFYIDPTTFHRVINWSGYEWWIKKSYGAKIGPGLNIFSDSTDNVYVDENGYLHLKITHDNYGEELCSEITSVKTFGYGTYEFELAPGEIHPNAVLGLFTWEDDAAAVYNREIDIEMSKWADPDNQNLQYVVQPYTLSENIFRFDMPLATHSVHRFNWQEGKIKFQSYYKNDSWPTKSDIISEWEYAGDYFPETSREKVVLNLWVFDNASIPQGETQEVIIKSFKFKCLEEIPGDINSDCKVDLLDFSILADNWLSGK
ncbi:MAG: glycoside hydrolase family 16 protein [Candidatus Nanoarchaeia archaeon]